MRPFALLVPLGLLAAAPALAAEEDDFLIESASDLRTLCAVDPADPNYAAALHMCHGYVVGVHQMHMAMENAMDGAGVYCLPATGGPSRSEAVGRFVAWAGALDRPDETTALDALLTWAQTEFPCPRGE